MLELIGVDGLTQWDVGRQVNVDKDVDMVHFSNRPYGYSKNVKVTDGVADVPDMFLTSCAPLRVWAYVGDFEKGYTKIEKIYEVKPKNRPEDYIYTPEEVKTWEKLQSEIGDLANLETESKDNLVDAINEVGSIQPDWNQNDETAKNYIKNRPFYEANEESAIFSGNVTFVKYTDLSPYVATYQSDSIGNVDNDYRIVIKDSNGEIVGDYTYSPVLIENGDTSYIMLGDTSEIQTSIPISQSSPNFNNRSFTTFKKFSANNICNITIYEKSLVVKQLDPKYIPVDAFDNKYTLPSMTGTTLGGAMADPAQESDTQPVRIGGDGKLYTAPGGTDISLGLTSAAVGQTIKVKAVDGTGKPTAWEAADMPSGESSEVKEWEEFMRFTVDNNETTVFDFSSNGAETLESKKVKEFYIYSPSMANTGLGAASVLVNDCVKITRLLEFGRSSAGSCKLALIANSDTLDVWYFGRDSVVDLDFPTPTYLKAVETDGVFVASFATKNAYKKLYSVQNGVPFPNLRVDYIKTVVVTVETACSAGVEFIVYVR